MSIVSQEFPPPADLSESSKALWDSLVPRRARSPERLELLTAALRARDRCEQLRQILRDEGLVIETAKSGVKHANPCMPMLESAEKHFARLWRELSLNFWPSIDR
jgi:phage terminase small subunit